MKSASHQLSLSEEQQIFVSKALSGNNILVDACVGSGKTTAIQALCDAYPTDTKILYLTYNKLLKLDAKAKITNTNVTVTNYHGFAAAILRKKGVHVGVSDMIQTFNTLKPEIEVYDVLVLDEYQDIESELAQMLEYIKSRNPQMQIVAVGDMDQKIYDKTTLDVKDFIEGFLGNHISLKFTQCFRLPSELAEKLGRIWNKTINGINQSCVVEEIDLERVVDFLSNQEPKNILCLGARKGCLSRALNMLEKKCPEKFNKKTVYASIRDSGDVGAGATEPDETSAIFTTFDSCKGLERKICVVFDFTESYWHTRIKEPLSSQKIIRNIFCVAASRGKDKILFVNQGEELLSEESLSNTEEVCDTFKDVDISSMFDFKYKEDVEKCFSLLETRSVPMDDTTEIDIKTTDNLIDLSPCIGIYQEAIFFSNYNIDKNIDFLIGLKKFAKTGLQNRDEITLDEKILLQTAIETDHNRYTTQVKPPIVSTPERIQLVKRLSTEFSPNEQVQVECSIKFGSDSSGKKGFYARGLVDVLKNDIVYELKFVSELKHEHFLQCACYVVALGLEKGVLWNVRKNEQFEISIPNKKEFLDAVAKAITKSKINAHHTHENEVIGIIDTETTWNDQVMSIGLVLADAKTFQVLGHKYYIIDPEYRSGGMYSHSLSVGKNYVSNYTSRENAIFEIKNLIRDNNISSLFAYNASFDMNHLPELEHVVKWYDIMKLAAYKQYNKMIPQSADCYGTGRLKKNFGVEAITRLLTKNPNSRETHNALLDAFDELEIMRLLGHAIDVYRQNALCEKNTPRKRRQDTPSSYDRTSSNRAVSTTTNNFSFYSPDWRFSDVDSVKSPTNKRMFTVKELAIASKMSESQIYNLIYSGELIAEKINGKFQIEEEEIYRYNKYHRKEELLNLASWIGMGVIALIFAAIIISILW